MIRKDLNSSSLTIPKPDWESYCHKVAELILSEQTPAKVMEVRGKFYELLSHCIPPTVILKVCHSLTVHALSTRTSHLSVFLQTVADKLVDQMDESLKADVMYWAAFYERRMRVGNKKIFHLEAWVVKVMSLYKVMYTPSLLVQGGLGGLLDSKDSVAPRTAYSVGALLIICILSFCSITSLTWRWTILPPSIDGLSMEAPGRYFLG